MFDLPQATLFPITFYVYYDVTCMHVTQLCCFSILWFLMTIPEFRHYFFTDFQFFKPI